MDDLHERLDRLAGRTTDERDAFERLGVARRRRDRRRRIGAGALALVIATGGTFAAVSAIRSGPSTNVTSAGYELSAVPYLWPENWARTDSPTPQDVQAEVDAGDNSLRWRTDPEEVAVRFGLNVIGWQSVGIRPVSYGPDVPGRVYEVSEACTEATPCPHDHQQYVWLRQPARTGSDGVWDVAGAWADTLDVGIGHQLNVATDTLVATGELNMDLGVPGDQTVIVGFNARNGCSSFDSVAQQGVDQGLGNGSYSLSLPDRVESGDEGYGCGNPAAGYAFAYTVPKLTVPVGDPFREAAGIVAVTAMPMLLDLQWSGSATPSPTADVTGPVGQLVIACDDAGARIVGSSEVIAKPDGAHLLFQPTTNGSSSLWVPGIGSSGQDGTNEMVVDAPPGPHTASCQTAGHTIGSATFTIVNPNGDWIPTPSFSGTTCSTANWEDAPPPPEYADPVEAAKNKLGSRSQPGDELDVVGYPEAAESRTVALVRDGVTVASVEIARGDSGWFASAVTTCD
jgi:hypothetical protein